MSTEFDYDSILSELPSQLEDELHIAKPVSRPASPIVKAAPPIVKAAPRSAPPPPVTASQPVSALADVGNLGRLAMFGNRPQVKRRSQLRREAEAAAAKASTTKEKTSEPVAIIRPGGQTPRIGSTPNKVSRGSTPSKLPDRTSRERARCTGPVTRSMANAGNGSMTIPSQSEFVKGIKERQRSCSSTSRVPSATSQTSAIRTTENRKPLLPTKRSGSVTSSTRERSGSVTASTRAPVVIQRSASVTRTAPVRPPTTMRPVSSKVPVLPAKLAAAPRDAVRKPVVVRQSPGVAFGSAVSKVTRVPYQERVQRASNSTMTPKKAVELRVYPGPSGTTPLHLPLTIPQTPHLMKHQKNAMHTPRANVFERLARPTVRTPAPVARNGVLNTFSHGIRVASVKRSRDGSASSQKQSVAP